MVHVFTLRAPARSIGRDCLLSRRQPGFESRCRSMVQSSGYDMDANQKLYFQSILSSELMSNVQYDAVIT